MSIEEKVKAYCEQMAEEKAIHAKNEALKKELKQALKDSGEKELVSGKYKVQLETRTSEGFDDTKLLMVLKEYWDNTNVGKCPWIATAEYVDTDALEQAIYKGDLPKAVLAKINDCRTCKKSDALTFKVGKGED